MSIDLGERIAYCSFCGRSQHEVSPVIAAQDSDAAICWECAFQCDKLLNEQATRALLSAPATLNYPCGSLGEEVTP